MSIPLIEFPEIINHYDSFFIKVFSPEALIQFKRYICGLIISENKTIDGMNRKFVTETRNQSSMNRFLNECPFSITELNNARLEMLSKNPMTQIKPRGVLSIDDTMLEHYGKNFEKIAFLFDHTQGRCVWAHVLVNLHYSDDITDYPIDFKLWQPLEVDKLEKALKNENVVIRENKYILKEKDPKKWRKYLQNLWRRHYSKPEVQKAYLSKINIAQELLKSFFKNNKNFNLPIAFDKWFTLPSFCNFIDNELEKPYVGTLKNDEKVVIQHKEKRIDFFTEELVEKHKQAVKKNRKPIFNKITIPYKGEKETYYSYCNTHRIRNYGRKRIVINFDKPDLSDAPVFYISNKLHWNAPGITRIRRHRWPIEVYHQEGKAEGLDKYQVRKFQAICNHIAFTSVVYSMFKVANHDKSLSIKLKKIFNKKIEGTQGYWRRNTQANAIWALASFISIALSKGQSLTTIMKPILESV